MMDPTCSEVKRLQLLLDVATGQLQWAEQQIRSDIAQYQRERERSRRLARMVRRYRRLLRIERLRAQLAEKQHPLIPMYPWPVTK